jgi:hypothetical protein
LVVLDLQKGDLFGELLIPPAQAVDFAVACWSRASVHDVPLL